MSDDATPFSLQIDSDWKRQAQEEKRRLAERQKQAEQQKQATRTRVEPPARDTSKASPAGTPVTPRTYPPATFDALVQTIATQTLYHLGELDTAAAPTPPNLDAARRQLDLLSVLERKTAGNLDRAETQTLDVALYDLRMRFASVASRYVL